MFKEAFIFGTGMVVDLSGSYYAQSQPPQRNSNDCIAHYWRRVGDNLRSSIEAERVKVELQERRQMHLDLGKE